MELLVAAPGLVVPLRAAPGRRGGRAVDGELCAWVAWPDVDMDAPASSGELRILAIARSLGGVASERSLADLLTSLDETNTARVLRAVSDRLSAAESRSAAAW